MTISFDRVLNNRLAFRDFHRFEVRGVYLSRKPFRVISPVPINSITYNVQYLSMTPSSLALSGALYTTTFGIYSY
jgi:hypothetical protein